MINQDEPQTAHKVINGQIVLLGGLGIEIFRCFEDVLKFKYIHIYKKIHTVYFLF